MSTISAPHTSVPVRDLYDDDGRLYIALPEGMPALPPGSVISAGSSIIPGTNTLLLHTLEEG